MLTESIIRTKEEMRTLVQDITNKLSAMAMGDMNLYMNVEYVGDFIPIQQSMDKILDSLNDMLQAIDIAAVCVDIGAVQVEGGARSLAHGTAEQANSVVQLNETIVKVTDQMCKVAADALDTSNRTTAAMLELEAGNGKMKVMTEAMGEINRASREIERIVEAIDEIAFQTNMLSLNAAVEAARSGSFGKGFAVVAEEVRNLAGRSAAAVVDARGLIEMNLRVVEKGREIAEDTARSVAVVLSAAEKVSHTMEEVSSAIDYNSIMIQQIREGMDQISEVVQSNSATAEESAAASEELALQAQKLKALVGGAIPIAPRPRNPTAGTGRRTRPRNRVDG